MCYFARCSRKNAQIAASGEIVSPCWLAWISLMPHYDECSATVKHETIIERKKIVSVDELEGGKINLGDIFPYHLQ